MSTLTIISNAIKTYLIFIIIVIYHLYRQQEIQYTNLLNQVMFINDNKKNKIRSLNKNIRDRTTS